MEELTVVKLTLYNMLAKTMVEKQKCLRLEYLVSKPRTETECPEHEVGVSIIRKNATSN
jgi:hypothetical protein